MENYLEAFEEANVYKITAPPPFDYYLPKTKRYGRSVEVRTEPKIGRNQLCPCGSGLKFKKCCIKSNPSQNNQEKDHENKEDEADQLWAAQHSEYDPS